MFNNTKKNTLGEVKKLNELPQEEMIKVQVEQGDITTTQALIEIANANASFFITDNKEVYATVEVNKIKNHYPVNSQDFKMFLRKIYYKIFKKTLNLSVITETIETIIALEGDNTMNKIDTFIRVGGKDQKVYLDLCTDNREIVEINTNGWNIIKDSPVKFKRTSTMQSLPIPEKGGSIKELDKFINTNDENKMLIYSFLLGCLVPTGPYPILIVQGPQGSGKSFFSRIIKSLVDPSFAPIRSIPKNEENLIISAQKNRLLAFDNLSGLSNAMSDALCKMATGSGFATRKFYENNEEIVFSAHRPLVLNGIDFIARRADLADRAIIINLNPINKIDRKTEEEILSELNHVKPRILGSLLDALSVALKEYNNVKLDSAPRMADFAKWATAAESGLGFEKGSFIQAFENNQLESAKEAVEHDLFISTIIECLEKERKISGNATTILSKLETYLPVESKKSDEWVKSPNQLKNTIHRVLPILESNNINYSFERNSNVRIHTLELL
ncbi:hypothetical protein [Halalkalibacter sp. APA_J-10(15)]|uniref:hypothetical protein n=1 Tax=Halalkalibacter sp. APA_J-10(15) TaxID=2933805 RepID=UPI001FF0F30A|nr:hypothetical protein [Halalkalibacter sp. APA_J-10(15)]MCK0473909.1 hypothetical protein [Halalkalibacter sp. APA_J-10(15)]